MIVRTKLARAKQTDIAFGICFTSLQSRSSLRDDRKRTACSETRATHTHTHTHNSNFERSGQLDDRTSAAGSTTRT